MEDAPFRKDISESDRCHGQEILRRKNSETVELLRLTTSAGAAGDNFLHVDNERDFSGLGNFATGVVPYHNVQIVGARLNITLR